VFVFFSRDENMLVHHLAIEKFGLSWAEHWLLIGKGGLATAALGALNGAPTGIQQCECLS